MSKIALEGNALGSGTFTIASPNSNTSRTLTLPDATGELALQFGDGVGKVLQLIRATDTTNRSTTSTSFTDITGMSVTITPQKADSRILIITAGLAKMTWSTGDNGLSYYQITDSSNNAISGAQSFEIGTFGITGTGTREVVIPLYITGYVTPNTTSAVTYKTRFRSGSSNTTSLFNNLATTGQMYAIEVAA
jgi:hypothetical protein